MPLQQTIAKIQAPDKKALEAARKRWDSVAKPLNGLGLLEEAVTRIAGMTGNPAVTLGKKGVVVMCADNGVVAQGVTQTGREVTAVVTENLARGAASVCKMACVAGADVFPVDIGVAREVSGPGLKNCKIAYGTLDMTKGPAMTRVQAVEALETGIRIAGERKRDGYGILATGEMGIGNTTTGSAVASVLLRRPPKEMTGRGAGLSSEGLRRKIAAIKTAIALNRPDPEDPLDVLAKVGGFDIAGLAGVFLGCAENHIPAVVDGFISSAAALAAVRLCPAAGGYLLASHVSKEPAAGLVLRELGLKPLLTAELCLGEGTGAVAVLPLLEMALAVYREMGTFRDIQIDAYQPQT